MPEKKEVKEKKLKEMYRVTTLGELGAKLPIAPRGIDGAILKDRDFSFREWDMEAEEKISQLQKDSINVGDFTNRMLCLLLDQFCGQDFQSKRPEAQTLLLNQLEFPNIMYMYVFLRVEELSQYLKMDVGCPNCKKLIENYMVDLEDLEIHVKDTEHTRVQEYTLVKPIRLEDGKIVTGMMIDVAKWDSLESASRDIIENGGKMKAMLFKSSISGVLEAKGPIDGFISTEKLIKKIKKIDIEKISNLVIKNNGGPSMVVGGKCPHCRTEFLKPLDWRYDYFFDSSSL